MKRIFLMTLLGIAGFFATAQKVNFGIHAGWNTTKINATVEDIDLTAASRGGYMAGLFARVGVGKFYIEPSLNYAHRACDLSYGSATGKMSYSSVDVPVMLGYNIVNVGLFKLRGYVGPEVSILTDGMKFEDASVEEASDMMWSGKVGVGIDVTKFTLDIDYDFGVKNFGDGVKKPNTLAVTLGFKIF